MTAVTAREGRPGIAMEFEFPRGRGATPALAHFELSPEEAGRLLALARAAATPGALSITAALGRLRWGAAGPVAGPYELEVGPESWRLRLTTTGEESGNGPSYALIEEALPGLGGGGAPPAPNSFFGMGPAGAIVALGEAALGREVFRKMVAEELMAALREEIRRADGANANGGG